MNVSQLVAQYGNKPSSGSSAPTQKTQPMTVQQLVAQYGTGGPNAAPPAPTGTQTQTGTPQGVPNIPSVQGSGIGADAANIGIGVQNSLKNTAVGVGSAIGQTGLGISDLFFKGASKVSQAIGDQPGVQFANTAAQKTQDISQGMYGTSLESNLDTNSGKVGQAIGNTASFFAPGSAEEAVFNKAAAHIDQLPDALGLAGDAAKTITGALKTKLASLIPSIAKIGTRAAISGTSMAGVTAAETGGNKQATETGGMLGAGAGALGEGLAQFGKPLADAFNKGDFKLSPAAEAKASAKAQKAAGFITDNKITGTNATKYGKLTKIISSFEKTLQESLPKTVSIAKQAIVDNINAAIDSLKTSDPAIYKTAKGDADDAIDLLKSQKGGTINGSITPQLALDSKRSYGAAAFRSSKAAVKDPQVVSEGRYAVEQGYYKALQDSMESTNHSVNIPPELQSFFGGKSQTTLQDFNNVYSNAISARQFTNLAQFKNDSALVGRMLSLWSGEALGQALLPGLGGKLVGAVAGEATLQHAPALLRNIGERAIEQGPAAIPGATKVGLGVTQNQ